MIAAWPDLNKKVSEAFENIDEAVRRVHRLATLSRIGDDYHRKQETDENFLSMIGIDEESSMTCAHYGLNDQKH